MARLAPKAKVLRVQNWIKMVTNIFVPDDIIFVKGMQMIVYLKVILHRRGIVLRST